MENEQNIQNQESQNTTTADIQQVPQESSQNQVSPEPQQQTPNQPATLQPPPQQNIDVMQPKSGKPNLLLTVGIILLIASIILGVASYFIRNKKTNSNEESTIVTPSPTQKTSKQPSPTPDPMANWKGAATKYYTVKYPTDSDMNIHENTMNITYWGPTQAEGTELFDGYSVTFHPIVTDQTPIEFANTQITEAKTSGLSEIVKDPEAITINNYEGITYTEEGLGTFQQIILRAKNSSVLVQISVIVTDPGSLGFQETVDQILSTLTMVPGV